MDKIVKNLAHISGSFKGILLDAYGVFWGGNHFGMLPGSLEAMEALVKSGKIVGICSNTTQLVSKEIDKYRSHGLLEGRHYHFLLTSGEMAKHVFCSQLLPFATPNKKYWIFGGVHPKYSTPQILFNGSSYKETKNLEDADFIYIAIPHINGEDQTNADLFKEGLHKIMKSEIPMVCANPDKFAHEGNPPKLVVRQGSIAAMFEEIGGNVFYIGKPYAMAYAAAMEKFKQFCKLNPKEILMVGDTPETDIRGARNFDMPSALVTKTGIMADRIVQYGLESALNLSSQDQPDFYIERVG